MNMRTVKLIKFQVAITAGIISVFTIFTLPTWSQETETSEEDQSVLVESTIVGEVDPADAVTVSDLDIPTDQLALLVKPLTLEELQVEAAAWLLLLKNKAQDISNAEVAIKRENQVIEAEQTAAAALESAQTKLSEAEAKLAETEEGTKEHENAYKRREDAKEALQTAQLAVEEAAKINESLKNDKSLQATLEEARVETQIAFAQDVLKAAKQERESLTEGSNAYTILTEKIDALDQVLVELKVAEEDLDGVIPGTQEYKKLSDAVTAARSKVNKATDALSESGIGPTNDLEDSQSIDESQTSLEKEAQQLAAAQDDIEGTANEKLKDLQEDLEAQSESQADIKNQLVAEATELQTAQAAIVDRFEVILDAIDKKGGDTISYRNYVDAVSGIEIDVTDTEGLGVRLVAWLTAEEGGQRWLINMARFTGILLVSVIAAQLSGQFANRALRKFGNTSNLFREFTVTTLKRTVLVTGALLALTSLGISLGPVLAVLGGASFVLAFALQSNLGNFASGLMLLVTKPFDVGDEVKVAGYWAYVDSISLANTKLKNFAGSVVTLPNNTVWGSDIVNYTHADIRKLMFTVYVKFDQDLNDIYRIWMDITSSQPKLLKDPAPGWFPWNSHYEYYIAVGLSAWSKKEDYWSLYVELLQLIQKNFQENHIELAAPQQTVNVSPDSSTFLPGSKE